MTLIIFIKLEYHDLPLHQTDAMFYHISRSSQKPSLITAVADHHLYPGVVHLLLVYVDRHSPGYARRPGVRLLSTITEFVYYFERYVSFVWYLFYLNNSSARGLRSASEILLSRPVCPRNTRVAFYISGLENKNKYKSSKIALLFFKILPIKIYTHLYAFEPIGEALLPL